MKQLYHDRGLQVYAENVGKVKVISFTITTMQGDMARTILTKTEAEALLDRLAGFVHEH